MAPAIFPGLLLPALGEKSFADELRAVAAIRELTVKQTQQTIPVQLRGMSTFFGDRLCSRFLQDETAGVFQLTQSTSGLEV